MFNYIRNTKVKFYSFDEDVFDVKSKKHYIVARAEVGSTWEDFLHHKFVPLSDEQWEWHIQYPNATPEEVWNMIVPATPDLEPEPIPEPGPKNPCIILANLKDQLRYQINEHDISFNVNSFLINDKQVWLDKETRTGLKLRLEAEEEIEHKEMTTLWLDGQDYTLPIIMARTLLLQIEVYASKCYDVTQAHLREVSNLTTVEDAQAYDITLGYPDKIQINL